MFFRRRVDDEYSATSFEKIKHADSIEVTNDVFMERYADYIKDDELLSTDEWSIKFIMSHESNQSHVILSPHEHGIVSGNSTYNGKYFIFLMTHSMNSKTDSFVGFSLNPINDVIKHNERIIVDRNTCMAAPHWTLDIVVGPFICKEVALDYGHALVNGTRGKEAKRNKIPYLCEQYNVKMYNHKMACSTEAFHDLLMDVALPEFAEMLNV
jgi:hypothetical protein